MLDVYNYRVPNKFTSIVHFKNTHVFTMLTCSFFTLLCTRQRLVLLVLVVCQEGRPSINQHAYIVLIISPGGGTREIFKLTYIDT